MITGAGEWEENFELRRQHKQSPVEREGVAYLRIWKALMVGTQIAKMWPAMELERWLGRGQIMASGALRM